MVFSGSPTSHCSFSHSFSHLFHISIWGSSLWLLSHISSASFALTLWPHWHIFQLHGITSLLITAWQSAFFRIIAHFCTSHTSSAHFRHHHPHTHCSSHSFTSSHSHISSTQSQHIWLSPHHFIHVHLSHHRPHRITHHQQSLLLIVHLSFSTHSFRLISIIIHHIRHPHHSTQSHVITHQHSPGTPRFPQCSSSAQAHIHHNRFVVSRFTHCSIVINLRWIPFLLRVLESIIHSSSVLGTPEFPIKSSLVPAGLSVARAFALVLPALPGGPPRFGSVVVPTCSATTHDSRFPRCCAHLSKCTAFPPHSCSYSPPASLRAAFHFARPRESRLMALGLRGAAPH